MTEELNGGCLDEREAFEACAGSLDSWLPNIKRSGDRYVSAVTAAAWHAWERRASLSTSKQAGAEPASPDAKTWCAYVAGIVEAYLNSNSAPEVREKAIAGIIERRLWALPSATPPAAIPAAPSDAVQVSRELLERIVERLRKAQIFHLSGELDAALTQPTTVQQASPLARKSAQVDVRAILEPRGIYLSATTIDTIVEAVLKTAQTTALPGGNGEGK